MSSSEGFPRFRVSDLWTWEGAMDRGPYALVGLLGFALKHNLDRWLAFFAFGRPWGIFNYWVPLDRLIHLREMPAKEQIFLLTMVAFSLPFIYAGLAMTMKRLRSAGLPSWMLVFFFAPFVNLLFFVVLALAPARETTEQQPWASRRATPWLARFIPDNQVGAAMLAVVLTGLAGTALTWLSVKVVGNYGWSLFVALPFCMGFVAALMYGYHHARSISGSIAVGLLTTVVLGLFLMAFAIEGVVCLAMAAPIGLTLSGVGGFVGYLVQRRPEQQAASPAMMVALIAAMPLLVGAEAANPQTPPLYEVVTIAEINARPEAVWQRVIGFTPLPEPTEWFFRAGIAYPMRAEMRGSGVGAERHCVFSTGSFVEPIEVWDAPRRLKFSVTSNPAPMQEWTPYKELDTEHLRGMLVSKGGQFHLIPLPGGRTRVEATTWYQHGLWPAPYWRLWSDWIIHRIHVRVLEHVKQQTEAGSS